MDDEMEALGALAEMAEDASDEDMEDMKKECEAACDREDEEMCHACKCMRAAKDCGESEDPEEEEACMDMVMCMDEGVYGMVLDMAMEEGDMVKYFAKS